MIYEESIIDGVLCWRMSPRDCKGYGNWIPKTAQELTTLVFELRQRPAIAPPAYPQFQRWVPFAPQRVPAAPWQPPFVVSCTAG